MTQLRSIRKLKLPSTSQTKREVLELWLAEQTQKEALELAEIAGKHRIRAEGLRAMTSNQDWLEGKPGSAVRS